MKKILNIFLVVSFIFTASFFVTTSTKAAGTIQVITPTAGEKLNSGQAYRITWQSSPSVSKVFIVLHNRTAVTASWIAFNKSNTGYYDWVVPSNLNSSALYSIEISGLIESTGLVEVGSQDGLRANYSNGGTTNSCPSCITLDKSSYSLGEVPTLNITAGPETSIEWSLISNGNIILGNFDENGILIETEDSGYETDLDGNFTTLLPDESAEETGQYLLTVIVGDIESQITYEVGQVASDRPSLLPPPVTGAHAPGSVVKTTDGTVWFITLYGQRRAFTSSGAFLSYGFLNFSQVVTANADDLALPVGDFIPPQDGKLICSDRDDSYAKKGTCYLITAGKRAAFTSSEVFTGQGFKFSRTTVGDVSFMANDSDIISASAWHRPGVLINNNGTIQLVGQSSLLGIPSEGVFTSWGYSYADTVPANTADRTWPQGGVMQSRTTGQLSPN